MIKQKFKEVGLYAILLYLLISVISSFWFIFKILSIGKDISISFYILFIAQIITIIFAIIYIFKKYKYNWVVISIPFFWSLLSYLLVIDKIIRANLSVSVLITYLTIILNILVIAYLFIKGIKKINDSKYELYFAIPIIFLLLIIILDYVGII